MFCGEGIYKNGEEGSPLIVLRELIKCFNGNSDNFKRKKVSIHFNDFGKSDIEQGINKIERVQKAIQERDMWPPKNVKLYFSTSNYNDVKENIITDLNQLEKNERALVFIDPWGYKDIEPAELFRFLKNGKTEIILFLPIFFIYRFLKKSLYDQEYKGGEAIRKFAKQLNIDKENLPNSVIKLNMLIEKKLRQLGPVDYVTSFTLQKDEQNNLFALYFLTSNQVGFLKMLEAKWALDEEGGRGFKLNSGNGQMSMFNFSELNNFEGKILEQLAANKGLLNSELLELGLKNGHLPKHTKEVLDKHKKKIEVVPLDNHPCKGYYIADKKRKVNIKFK